MHLNDDKYKDMIEEFLIECAEKNVLELFIVGDTEESSKKAVQLQKKYNGYKGLKIYALGGIHPSEVKDTEDFQWLIEMLEKKEIIGVGEIGMDLYWDKSKKDLQIKMFKQQLEIAAHYKVPVSIHSREATEVTYNVLKNYNTVKGIIHCYSGSVEFAKKYIDLGYKLGIGGVLTFKNSRLWEVIATYDLENFVTETDAPYLAPEPHRGHINKSSYIPLIVDRMAQIKNIKVEDVEKILERNTKDIYDV